MSTDDIGRIYSKLDDMVQRLVRVEEKQDRSKEDLADIKSDINGIRNNGCNKAAQHLTREEVAEIIKMTVPPQDKNGFSFRGLKLSGPAAMEFAKTIGVFVGIALVIGVYMYFSREA